MAIWPDIAATWFVDGAVLHVHARTWHYGSELALRTEIMATHDPLKALSALKISFDQAIESRERDKNWYRAQGHAVDA